MNFTQLRSPSHPSRGIPTAVNCLATLLKEPLVRSSFVQADGVKLLIPLINPVSNQTTPIASAQTNQQQSMQVKLCCILLWKRSFLLVSASCSSSAVFLDGYSVSYQCVFVYPFILLHGCIRLLYFTAPLWDMSLYLAIVILWTCSWILGYF